MIVAWAGDYSAVVPFRSRGRDRDGVDCWGLVCLVYREQFGVELPHYSDEYSDAQEYREVSRAIHAHAVGWKKVETPEPGDVVIAWQRSRSDWSHVGIYVGDGQILHSHSRNGYALIHEADDVNFWGRRIVGYFRHPQRFPQPEVLPALPPDSRVAGYVTVTYLPSIVSGDPVTERIIAGPTIETIVRQLGIVGDVEGYIHVEHNGLPVKRERWSARPKAGTFLSVTPVPGEPATIIAILVIAAKAVASFATGMAAGALTAVGAGGLGASVLGAGFSLGSTAIFSGFAVGQAIGTMALYGGVSAAMGMIAKSVAAPSGSSSKSPAGPGATRSGGNFGNQMRLFEPVPVGYGKLKIQPPLAARPYYEFMGDKKFVRAIFCVGLGRYKISDVRVNDVPLEDIAADYEDGSVEYHLIEGGVPTGGYVGEVTDDAIGNAANHYWRLHETGATSNDYGTAANRNLTRTNCTQVAGLITGESNEATELNGTSSRLTTTAGPVIADGNVDWTIEGWFKPLAGMALGGESCIWFNGDTTSGWGLYLFGRPAQGAKPAEPQQRLRLKLFGSGGAAILEFGTPQIDETDADPRYHIGIRYTASTKTLHCFVNTAKKEKKLPTGVTFSTPANAFTIGAERASGGTFSKFVKMVVDECATYPKALQNGVLFWRHDQGKNQSVTRGGVPRFYVDTVLEAVLPGSASFDTPNADLEDFPENLQDPDYPGCLLPAWMTIQIPGAVDEIEVNWEWTRGIYRLADSGAGRKWEVRLQIHYRRTDIDNAEWVSIWDMDYVNQKTRHTMHGTTDMVTVPHGEYEVRIRPRWDRYSNPNGDPDTGPFMNEEPINGGEKRTEGGAGAHPENYTGGTETSVSEAFLQIVSVRGYVRNQKPVSLDGLCMFSLRLPVQASGTVSCTYERLLPVWDDVQGWLPEQITRSAAWACLDVLRGTQDTNPRPVPDDLIKLLEFHTWANRGPDPVDATLPICPNVDLYVDYASNTFSLFQQIAGLGFASMDYTNDGLIGVIEDRNQTVPVGMVTARNAQGYKGRIFLQDTPHAILVRFISESQHFLESQMMVFDDGYSDDGTNDKFGLPTVIATKFEEMRILGLVSHRAVERHVRIRQLLHRLRNEEWEQTHFLDAVNFRRGKLVKFAHPAGLIGQRQYRVASRTPEDPGVACTEITLEVSNLVYASGKNYAATWWRYATADPFTKVVSDRPVNNLLTTTNRIVFTTPVPAADAPNVGDLVAFGELNLVTVDCIIRAIRPNPDGTGKVELIPATPTVFTNWDSRFAPRDPMITIPPPLVQPGPYPPTILKITSGPAYVRQSAENDWLAYMLVTFTIPSSNRPHAERVQPRFRLTATGTVAQPWTTGEAISADSHSLLVGPVMEGAQYEVQLRALSADAVASNWSAPPFTHTVTISTFGGPVPADVQSLRVEAGMLRWEYAEQPLGFAGFKVRWNYGNTGGQASAWAIGQPAHESFLTSNFFSLESLPSGEPITVLVKAYNKFGGESANAVYVVLNLANKPATNVIMSVHQDPVWAGTKTNCTVVDGNLVPNASGADTVEATYEYIFIPDAVKLGVALAAATKRIASGPFQTRLDYRTGSRLPFWNPDKTKLFWDLDGDGDVDPTDKAMLFWKPKTPWSPFPRTLIPESRIRYDFKLTLKPCVGGVALGAAVDEHQLFSDVPDLKRDVGDLFVPKEGVRVPVNGYFDEIRTVTVTVQGLIGARPSLHLMDKNTNGPLIRVTSGGNPIEALVDVHVVGVPSKLAIDLGLV